jgi:hypothetical protein
VSRIGGDSEIDDMERNGEYSDSEIDDMERISKYSDSEIDDIERNSKCSDSEIDDLGPGSQYRYRQPRSIDVDSLATSASKTAELP